MLESGALLAPSVAPYPCTSQYSRRRHHLAATIQKVQKKRRRVPTNLINYTGSVMLLRKRNLCRFSAGLMAAGFLAGIALGVHPLVSVALILGVMLLTTGSSSVEARAGPSHGYAPSYNGNAYGLRRQTVSKQTRRHLSRLTATSGGIERLCRGFAATQSPTAHEITPAFKHMIRPSNGPHQHHRTYGYYEPIRASPACA